MSKAPRLPEFLASGERARLIPVAADTSKEVRATSVLLATLSAVYEFRKNMFEAIGVRIGARSQVDVYTEVVFSKSAKLHKLRPDGLIVITTGKRKWTALVEAKIGNADLTAAQIEDYIRLARDNDIDAVITLSNQFAAIPTHHPVDIKKSTLRSIGLYHWSWMFGLTEALLLIKNLGVQDKDQAYILAEMVRYFHHDKVGVSTFDRMNSEWKDVVLTVRSGARLSKASDSVKNTIASWHQEERDLCLVMTRNLAVPISLKLTRKHTKDPVSRLKDDCEAFSKTAKLGCVLEVPDAAGLIEVEADLKRRTVSCAMKLQAPEDKQRSTARVNWLLRQLKTIDPGDIYVRALWPGRAASSQALLNHVREDSSILLKNNPNQKPVSFEVLLIKDLAGKFSGSRTFIECLEQTVPDFYERVGQHVRAWVPEPPKVKSTPEPSNTANDSDDRSHEADQEVIILPPPQTSPYIW